MLCLLLLFQKMISTQDYEGKIREPIITYQIVLPKTIYPHRSTYLIVETVNNYYQYSDIIISKIYCFSYYYYSLHTGKETLQLSRIV